ncbi:abhydrolase domain containing 12 [Coprinopsis cinerea okayama7|uniref:Abhydrolase domain containing 12 n=1 Tax=Coprinopsis cinerea (strain Okayama-7 / 130 / ATCC MYA-4618 / FGSC 9003) TaxID=240176 RepID=A8NRX1_COPC7|nr:abhydrolase domain containing 12 [Coprinopsis cinerea okayama7\|eukprot:XP_001835878.2 abhydrolase domain containing 12 [Coprinopsis cinerea okayama7\
MLYLNAVRVPFGADFDSPESYGLALSQANKTLNFLIQTPDKESIGAWFLLSEEYYQSLPSIPTNVSEHVAPALKARPTILYLHGNAATRAASMRVAQYQALTARLGANVLAIDYRGYAESTGVPSESGLVTDARAAFDWLVDQGVRSDDILVMGHSLGTGVGSQLGAQLGAEGIKPRGVVLMSPFVSMGELLQNYHLFGFIPLIKPLYAIPGAAQIVTWALVHKFDSLGAVPNITADVLIAHAENDWEIPDSHSDILFQAFMEPYLPDVSTPELGKMLSPSEWEEYSDTLQARLAKREALITSTPIPRFGRVDEFKQDGRTVLLVKSHVGSHNLVGIQEGLQDIIKKKFRF